MTRVQLLALAETWGLRLATVAGVAARFLPDIAGVLGVVLLVVNLSAVYQPLGGLFLGAVLVYVAWRHGRPPPPPALPGDAVL